MTGSPDKVPFFSFSHDFAYQVLEKMLILAAAVAAQGMAACRARMPEVWTSEECTEFDGMPEFDMLDMLAFNGAVQG